MADASRRRVTVIGAGFGGMAVTNALRGADVDITLIDANNFHTFQPLLYQVATAGLSVDDVTQSIRGSFRGSRWRTSDVDVVMGRVSGVDSEPKLIHLADGRSLEYDILVVAAGAVTADFGIAGVHEHSFPLKSTRDAMELRTHLLANFERAAADRSTIAQGALDVVVAGGGPTGVEMAGGIAELYRRVLAQDFPDVAVGQARIVLIEMADRLLPPFTEASGQDAASTLEKLGVELRLGTSIDEVHADGVTLASGERIDAATTVWAAGVRASPLAEAFDLELTAGGRLPVDDYLRVEGFEDVYAIGDIAGVIGPDGAPLPQVAQPAIQQGKYVGTTITARLSPDATAEPFSYFDRGSMATIGRNSAVAELPNGWRLNGFVGWISWLGLHLLYLMGFRNRISVFVNWCWNYLTYDRASRLLSESDLHHDDFPIDGARRHRDD